MKVVLLVILLFVINLFALREELRQKSQTVGIGIGVGRVLSLGQIPENYEPDRTLSVEFWKLFNKKPNSISEAIGGFYFNWLTDPDDDKFVQLEDYYPWYITEPHNVDTIYHVSRQLSIGFMCAHPIVERYSFFWKMGLSSYALDTYIQMKSYAGNTYTIQGEGKGVYGFNLGLGFITGAMYFSFNGHISLIPTLEAIVGYTW